MRAKLLYLHSPDVPDLETWIPEDPRNVGIFIQMMVGPEGEPGSESFDLMVGTPTWLAKAIDQEGGHVVGRHYLFVNVWDYPTVERLLTAVVDETEGDDWAKVTEKIGRVGRYEFEDYDEWGNAGTPSE